MISKWVNKIGYALAGNKSYKEWSQRQYDRWGSKLNPLQKKISALEFSPDVKRIVQALSEALPKAVANQVMKHVLKINKKYGANQAEKWIKHALKVVKSIKF